MPVLTRNQTKSNLTSISEFCHIYDTYKYHTQKYSCFFDKMIEVDLNDKIMEAMIYSGKGNSPENTIFSELERYYKHSIKNLILFVEVLSIGFNLLHKINNFILKQQVLVLELNSNFINIKNQKSIKEKTMSEKQEFLDELDEAAGGESQSVKQGSSDIKKPYDVFPSLFWKDKITLVSSGFLDTIKKRL